MIYGYVPLSRRAVAGPLVAAPLFHTKEDRMSSSEFSQIFHDGIRAGAVFVALIVGALIAITTIAAIAFLTVWLASLVCAFAQWLFSKSKAEISAEFRDEV